MIVNIKSDTTGDAGSIPVYSSILRVYPSGEGIRLISVNAAGSIPATRI